MVFFLAKMPKLVKYTAKVFIFISFEYFLMNFEQKFNRAFIKQFKDNNVTVTDFNGGAIRYAEVKLNFSHNNEKNFFKLTASRQPDNLSHFGYNSKNSLEIYKYNATFSSGFKQDIDEFDFIDPLFIKQLSDKTNFTKEDENKVLKVYNNAIESYIEIFNT